MHKQAKNMSIPLTLFYSYASEDELLCRELEKHLSLLQRRGIITGWHKRNIVAGADWKETIDSQLDHALLILLLITPDFLASDYCYGIEMQRAMERHDARLARVIPILLRPVDWHEAHFAHLQCLPHNEQPVTLWSNRDEAFLDIVKGIRTAIDYLRPALEEKHRALVLGGDTGLFSPADPPENRPKTYIPHARNDLFQVRPGEFEHLENILLAKALDTFPSSNATTVIEEKYSQTSHLAVDFPQEVRKRMQASFRAKIVGMVGMGGVGKTQLAVEFAYRYEHYFPSGIFWMPALGTTVYEWQSQLAQLADNTSYFPSWDNIAHPENELSRAKHFCDYLTRCHDALLILDHVEDPSQIQSILTSLAGREIACTILYTSRKKFAPPGVVTHVVELLPEKQALRLLLGATRLSLFEDVLKGNQNAEVRAARDICQGVGRLPLALMHFRSLLIRDSHITLSRFAEDLKQRGALEIAKLQEGEAQPLDATFQLSWEKVHDERAQKTFVLASFFKEAVPIPLWLLGLMTGLGERGDILSPLGRVLSQLEGLSLLEKKSADTIQLHALVREFGQRLITKNDLFDLTLLITEVVQRLTSIFQNLNNLENYALLREEYSSLNKYSECIERLQLINEYIKLLGAGQEAVLSRIERWLARESYLLGNEALWPNTLPGLFYQQLFNRSVEEECSLFTGVPPVVWLRQEKRIGAEDHSLMVFEGHKGGVSSVMFSRDGTNILTGSLDGTARFWEVTGGKVLARLEEHTGEITSIAFSPNGTMTATGSSDRTAQIWQTTSNKILLVLEEHPGWVTSVIFSHDNQKVLTSCDDGIVRVWDVNSGSRLMTIEGHAGAVWSVVFSPDGKKVLTGSDDRTARIWDVISGKQLLTLEGHTNSITCVAFSPNGKHILTASADQTTRVWEVITQRTITILRGHTGGVKSIAFSPDGKKVLTGSHDRTARMWEVTMANLQVKLGDHTDKIKGVVISPDGKQAATGSDDHTVRLWTIADEKVQRPLEGHSSEVRRVVFSPDGTRVLTGSDDGTARLWDATKGSLLTLFKGHTDGIGSVAFSPDGTRILTEIGRASCRERV